MDPDEALEAIRELIDANDPADYDELRQRFTVLDAWLCSGGFPPGEWSRAEDD
jgi:hypothetical protein